MRKTFTSLLTLLILINVGVFAQYTTDGLYTIQNLGTSKYMAVNPANAGDVLMSDNADAYAEFYVVQNSANAGKYNFITKDESNILFGQDGTMAVLSENTEANRNDVLSLISFNDQTGSYYLEFFPDEATLKRFNGQRTGDTDVGVGGTGSDKYKWVLTRIGDMPAANTAPIDIALSATAIDEGNAADAVVGTLSATDADAGDTFTYTFEADETSGADNNDFTITGDALSINVVTDFATKSEYKINVKVTDAGGLSFVKAFTITVNDPNYVSMEGLYTIQCVGDATNGGKYMTGGTPGKPMPMKADITDDAKFYIVENEANPGKYNIISMNGAYLASTTGGYGTLVENTEANRDSSIAAVDIIEQEGGVYYIETYPIIGTFDGTTLKRWNGQRGSKTQVGMGTNTTSWYHWVLDRIGDVPTENAAPVDIIVSVDSIAENNAVNDTVGTLAVADPNPVDTHTLSLVAGDGTNDADNASFSIANNVLTISVATDFETKDEYKINVGVTDAGGLTYSEALIISVYDVIEDAAPIADAGTAQTVMEGTLVTLDGSASSDANGDALTYAWTAPEGITLDKADTVKPSFTAPAVDAATEYTFTLVVNDGISDSEPATVVITVTPNTAPVANAGAAQTVVEGETVTLDGSGSSDAEDSTLTYIWSAPEGIVLTDETTVNPKFTAPAVDDDTEFTITLVVNDGMDDSEPATVVITVTPANTAPVADAGSDKTVTSEETVNLDGSASADADDDALTYLWTAPEGITLTGETTVNPTFTAPTVDAATDYTFTLVVNDGTVDSEPATVVVTVNPKTSALNTANAVEFSVYPNPSNGMFSIETEAEVIVVVRDVVGRTVKTEMFEAGTNTLDITAQKSGLYLLTVKEGNKVSTMKLKIK